NPAPNLLASDQSNSSLSMKLILSFRQPKPTQAASNQAEDTMAALVFLAVPKQEAEAEAAQVPTAQPEEAVPANSLPSYVASVSQYDLSKLTLVTPLKPDSTGEEELTRQPKPPRGLALLLERR
ncbi:MAG: hypothetical protein ACKPKO_54050, partial [Candidatus Fonsibacter sp.]